MQGGGFHCPPHLLVKTEFMEATSYGHSIAKLGKEIKSLIRYLQFVKQMSGKTITRTDGKVFIGHGGSPVWRDLKDFLQDRLGLTWDEFNRESTSGLSTKDRLEAMLDDASFALLVKTACEMASAKLTEVKLGMRRTSWRWVEWPLRRFIANTVAKALAKRYRVSTQVVLRRLYTLWF